jgi:hypothetical protein
VFRIPLVRVKHEEFFRLAESLPKISAVRAAHGF